MLCVSQGLRVDAKDAPRTDVGTTGPRFAGLKWPATMYLAPSAPAAAQAAAVLPAAAAAAGSNAATAGQGGPVRSRPASQLEAAFEAILRAGRSGGSMAAAAAEWARAPATGADGSAGRRFRAAPANQGSKGWSRSEHGRLWISRTLHCNRGMLIPRPQKFLTLPARIACCKTTANRRAWLLVLPASFVHSIQVQCSPVLRNCAMG